jgi:hypothetical protein
MNDLQTPLLAAISKHAPGRRHARFFEKKCSPRRAEPADQTRQY